MSGAACVRGAEAAFLLPGFSDMDGVLAQLRAGGIGHVVLLSGSSAESGDTTNAVTAYMVASERSARSPRPRSATPPTTARPTA